ncbi:MAG: hypothetical protein AcusKO_43940 [Acuticoccus sp.]
MRGVTAPGAPFRDAAVLGGTNRAAELAYGRGARTHVRTGIAGRSVAVAAGLVASLALYAGLAVWLYGVPASLSSDDAFFFSRGLERFSLLDFSPHFPGYPGFILTGRLFLAAFGEPAATLQTMSVTFALALPALAYLTAARWRLAPLPRTALLLAALSMPLLPLVALDGLSDGAGVALFVASLAVLPRQPGNAVAAGLVAGLFLGLSVTMRPSLAVLPAVMVLVILIEAPRLAVGVILGGVLAVVPAALFVWAHEGAAVVGELERFVVGHTLAWGNTVFAGSEARWTAALGREPFLAAAVALAVATGLGGLVLWRRLALTQKVVTASLLAIAIWTWAMQNPDNLRHLLPLLVLGPLALVAVVRDRRAATLCLGALLALNAATALRATASWESAPAPLAAAARHINVRGAADILVTHRGVHLLRAELRRTRVYDGYSAAGAAASRTQDDAATLYRLTGTRPETCDLAATFGARVPGERTLHLCREPAGDAR